MIETEKILEQSEQIFKHLYKTARAVGTSPTYDHAIQLKVACLEATAKIMQAQIITTINL